MKGFKVNNFNSASKYMLIHFGIIVTVKIERGNRFESLLLILYTQCLLTVHCQPIVLSLH